MFPSRLPSCVVDSLYQELERLERRWISAGLCDDFSCRMFEATLRFLARRSASLPSDTRKLTFIAVNALRYIWKRNARRDAARLKLRRQQGAIPVVVSLTAVDEKALACSGSPMSAADALYGGELGRGVVDCLCAHGWRVERAWAFVLYAIHADWSEVVYLLHDRLGYRATEVQLRQWASRYFPQARLILQAWLKPLD